MHFSQTSLSFIEAVNLRCYLVTQLSPHSLTLDTQWHPSTLANHPKMRAMCANLLRILQGCMLKSRKQNRNLQRTKVPQVVFSWWRMHWLSSNFYPNMVQNPFFAVFTRSARVELISKDPNFCHNLVTAPNYLRRLNSQSWDGRFLVWRDVTKTSRGQSKKFGQDGQLEIRRQSIVA